jgi:hypothetical protein
MSKGRPLLAKLEKDQCEAVTLETHWKRERKLDLRCPFVARLSVGKKRLCHKHAQCEALALLIADGRAKILPAPQARQPYQPVSVIEAKNG